MPSSLILSKEAEMFKGRTNEEFTGTRSPRLLNEAMG
jgi:hypothetical protein